MIITAIITFITGIINFILSLLPNVDNGVITTITSSLSGFRSALGAINWFFPVDTALSFLGIIFTIQATIFLFKIFRYIGSVLSGGFLK